jgi:hypothetical protein
VKRNTEAPADLVFDPNEFCGETGNTDAIIPGDMGAPRNSRHSTPIFSGIHYV